MDDEELRRGVIRLYALDDALGVTASWSDPQLDLDGGELRVRCTEAIWDRLMTGEVDLRVWLSRLVREVFLSEPALERGLGIEDACDFWGWFDRTMWREAVLREPVPTTRPALRRLPTPDAGPACSSLPSGSPAPDPSPPRSAGVSRPYLRLERSAGSTG